MKKAQNKTDNGLKINRLFTQAGQNVYDQFEYDLRSSVIRNPAGDAVFEMHNVEVPKNWSQVATDILAQKYFRKAGVPQPDGSKGSETSVKQVAHRLAECWRVWGQRYGYFSTEEDGKAFYDELVYMLLSQMAAPNSPQWFNTGLFEVYGIDGPPQGHWYVDPVTEELTQSTSAYERPQPHACARGNTRLFTNQGVLTIQEIVENNKTDLKVFDGTRWVKVLAVKNNGEREVYRATLNNGNYIEFTDDHQVWASDVRRKEGGQYAWQPFGSLLNKKVVQTSVAERCKAPKNVLAGQFTESEEDTLFQSQLLILGENADETQQRLCAQAALAGWVLGDGYYGKYNKNQKTTLFGVITINDDEFEYVKGLFQTLFGQYTVQTKPEVGDFYRIVKRDSKQVDDFVSHYELDKTSFNASVPEAIFKGSTMEQAYFLRSLFQADGAVRIRNKNGRNSGDVVLSTISEQLAHDVQLLLLNLGIYSKISVSPDKRENRKPLFQVVIANWSERKKFQNCIGFISTEKNEKLAQLNVLVLGKAKRAASEETVIDYQPVGVHTVYDIQTESGKFSANGVTVHNCFILSVKDDLVNEGGIMDLWVREARIFKYGSGVGTNFSNIRAEGEPLSGGGTSSGLMSFLKIGDRAAGAIKSGGTTRRAAKMVVLDADHPEIMDFIHWKVQEEKKVAALIAAGYPSDYEGEAYRTVSGQNSNNSIRLPHSFLEALESNGDWYCTARGSGKVMKTYKARQLWDEIAKAAWSCADPGLQFHTTINDWHTCPADGEIRASNPCSEYLFLDDTACNLASINLRKLFDENKLQFNIAGFEHACRLWTVVLEISVLMAHYPSRDIAKLSYDFRTLGLGYANLGSVLMVSGIPYDSPKATAIAGAVTSIMTGTAYATSAELAKTLGTFSGYERNKENMLRVMRNHRYAAYNADDAYENLSVKPVGIDQKVCPPDLLKAACDAWDKAVQWGEKYGYRNAQTTVLAPTGTIGLLMDCDTTGVEPDFALVKFKKLSGGGYFKIINQAIPLALKNLGYGERESNAIINYVLGHGTLKGSPFVNPQSLKEKGFTDADLKKVEGGLASAFEIGFVFNQYTFGEETMQRLGFKAEEYGSPKFNLLRELGFTSKEIEAANEYVCGTMTIEGAPFLKEEHYPVFDCANKCGKNGQRFIHVNGHIRMMAAAQPFITGAISKTINLPHEATWEDIEAAHKLSWELGLKAISIYRDGSKLSQPLSSKSDKEEEKEETKENSIEAALPSVNAAAVPVFTQDAIIQTVKKILAESNDNDFKGALRRIINRRPMPAKRRGFTQKAKVGGQTIFLRTGEYEDGALGEIFIDMHKEGATLRSMLNCFAIAISIGLQYGVPLDEYVDKFTFTRFEPSGFVEHENIKNATSILDYIFRLLAFEYLDRDDLVQAPGARINEKLMHRAAAAIPQFPVHVTSPDLEFIIKPNDNAAPQPTTTIETTKTSVVMETTAVKTNGNGAGHTKSTVQIESAQKFLSEMMGDAPACSVCGHITVRNGTCYKCLNCGNSMGCS